MSKILYGDALECLKTIPDNSVNMCVTSPPYYGLRDYGIDEQIGMEVSPVRYIEKLVCIFREIQRILKNDGTLWVNIADSYAGSIKSRIKLSDNAEIAKEWQGIKSRICLEYRGVWHLLCVMTAGICVQILYGRNQTVCRNP